MRFAFCSGWSRATIIGLILGAVRLALAAEEDAARTLPPRAAVTNLAQLRQWAGANPTGSYAVRVEGDVWWVSRSQGRIVLKDESGAEALEVAWQGSAPLSGHRVRLEGEGTISRRGHSIRLGTPGPVVDNNGVHRMMTKSGAVGLKAGRQPIRLEWFNGVDRSGLSVEYEGPGLSRQKIPDAALFRMQLDTVGGTSNLVNGLDYHCYEVSGEVLPDFRRLTPIKSGAAANFNLEVLPRDEHVGAQFTGFLAVSDGLYIFHLTSDDGSRLFVGDSNFRVTVLGQAAAPVPNRIAIGQVLKEGDDRQWVEVEGKVTLARDQTEGLWMELSAGSGSVRVEVADAAGLSTALVLNKRIRATGFCQSADTTDGQRVPGLLLVADREAIKLIESQPDSTSETRAVVGELPLLTTAAEVHHLKREEAARGYPVRIRGVVTSVQPEHQAVTIQDATRGLYAVDFSPNRSAPPQVGELLEIEGVTDPGLFAPVVNARRLESHGLGQLPAPVLPTWDQLLNGSLDAQYVEIQGVVTALLPDGVTLLTRGGVIRVELRLTGQEPKEWVLYENAVVRMRGCLFAKWDYATHQVKLGEIRIYDADVFVDQPAPQDLFSSQTKSAAELLLFDPQAGAFQRVKVSGQIVQVREPEHFMMDASNGLRFLAKDAAGLKLGDQVDVVGFPDLFRSATPVLREAVVRKTGNAALPGPRKLLSDNLVNAAYDSTRVCVEGVLVGVRTAGKEHVLELQHGVRIFAGRLLHGEAPALPVGSRLELVGVYVGQGGSRAAGQNLAAFELLLDSPADIRVLARPPWWTFERLLVILGVLALVLSAAALWITQLHRQVEQRTAELGEQIQERQRVEHQRAMEQERARIAQDLHDELGSGITEISMLAARVNSVSAPEEKRVQHLALVGDKAREMVTALDEIVWAMNSGHDSLASLVSYFSLYADRFLGLANIAWRLEGSAGPADLVLDSRRRHQLFLAFKEALTNVVRHSGATEVRWRIHVEAGQLCMSITDNGLGVPSGVRTEEMNGVANMRARLGKMGGRFEMTSEPGRGTQLRFQVPLN